MAAAPSVETDQMVAYNLPNATPAFHTTKSYRDGAGRVLQTFDALNNATTMQYDATGNLVSVRNPNSVGWDASKATAQPISGYSGGYDGYDALNRPTNRIDTQGDRTSTAYDLNGNVIKTVDGNSIANGTSGTIFTAFAYDARDRKISKTDRLSGVTSWTYDANGNLLTMTDPDNQAAAKATVWTYDARNQKLTETYPDYSTSPAVNDRKTFAYDPIGRPGVFTDQMGDTVTHAFDMADRLTSRTYRLAVNSPNGQIADTDSFTYDDAGRMLCATSGRYNNSVALAFDAAGRKVSEALTVNFGTATTYTIYSDHDSAGNRAKIWYPDNNSYPNSPSVERTYTDRDQLHEIKYNSNVIDTRSYDSGGRLTGSAYANGVSTTFAHDRQDDLVSAISDSGNVAPFAYTYDANKNKLTETIDTGSHPMHNYGFTVPTSGGYDQEDRLLNWQRVDAYTQLWSLSNAGDWNSFDNTGTPVARTHDAVHELTQVGSTSLAYADHKGNLTTNANGQVYTWDFDNRLRTARVGDNTHSYTYDALGRRV